MKLKVIAKILVEAADRIITKPRKQNTMVDPTFVAPGEKKQRLPPAHVDKKWATDQKFVFTIPLGAGEQEFVLDVKLDLTDSGYTEAELKALPQAQQDRVVAKIQFEKHECYKGEITVLGRTFTETGSRLIEVRNKILEKAMAWAERWNAQKQAPSRPRASVAKAVVKLRIKLAKKKYSSLRSGWTLDKIYPSDRLPGSYFLHVFDKDRNVVMTAYAEKFDSGWSAIVEYADGDEHEMDERYESYEEALHDAVDWACGQ